jgi:hypothetical protein
MNYSRANVEAYYAGLTPDSRPCFTGICPLMAAYPSSLRTLADATRADVTLVRALDGEYKRLYGARDLPWGKYTAGQILAVIRSLPL